MTDWTPLSSKPHTKSKAGYIRSAVRGTVFPGDVSVAVIAYNAVRTLPVCLRGIVDTGCPDDRITVYDVASTDGTGRWVKEHYPGVRVVGLEENRGPNPARNLAVMESETPFVVVMDSDVQMLAGTVLGLREAIGEDERIAVATPVVMYADRPDTVQYSRTFVHFLAEASAEVDDKRLSELRGETARVGVASGCAPMIRKSAAVEVGLFDERYFFGKTDGEFAYRVTLGGWQIVEPASAQVLHHHHKRGSMYFTHQVRNRWHFMLKDFQWRTLIAILPVLLVHEPALFVLLLVKGRVGDYFRALGSLLKLLPALGEDRRGVARIRRVHDWQVLRGDKLVIPAAVGGGALGALLSVYAAGLGVYWSAARWVLSMVSAEVPGGVVAAGAGGLSDKRADDGPSSRNPAA
jgi:GT2 family glycosyltransferase